MSTENAPEIVHSAPLPSLPDAVEAWMTQLEGDERPTVVLQRHNGKRWVGRSAIAPDKPLRETIDHAVTIWVGEHGQTNFRLSAKDVDAVEWSSFLDANVAIQSFTSESFTPEALLAESWNITFRATQAMIDAASAAPRLVTAAVAVWKDALDTVREVSGTSESATLAAVQADASQAKLDKLVSVLETLTANDAPKTKAKTAGGADIATWAARLIGLGTEDEVAAMFREGLGAKMLAATDRGELTSVVNELWGAHTAGKVKLSKDTLAKCKELVAEFNKA